MEQFGPYLSPAVALAALVYAIISARSKANNERVTAVETSLACKAESAAVLQLDARLDEVEDKVIAFEGKLDSLPDKDAMHRLELSVTEMKGGIDLLGERIKPIANTCARLQEALEERKA